MKSFAKTITAAALACALLAGSAGALDLSWDNYVQVARENSVTVRTNERTREGTRRAMQELAKLGNLIGNPTLGAYTGSAYGEKKLNERKMEVENGEAVYEVGQQLLQYYGLLISKNEADSQLMQLNTGIYAAEKLVEQGMKTQVEYEDLLNTREDVYNQMELLDTGIAALKQSIAISLGTTSDELNIARYDDYSTIDAEALKERLEAKYDYKTARKNSDYITWAQYNRGLQANQIYNALDGQMKSLEEAYQEAYETNYQNMMTQYASFCTAQKTYEKKRSDFELLRLKHDIGMLSDVDYLTASEDFQQQYAALQNAALSLQNAEIQVDAMNDGVWLDNPFRDSMS